jgi:uncharacterized Rmd1/YagE family protein
MRFPVQAYQLADSVDLRALRATIALTPRHQDTEELFYETGPERYVSVFRYGAACFFNYPEDAIRSFRETLQPFCRHRLETPLQEELSVETGVPALRISNNEVAFRHPDPDPLRIVMLHVAQSVTLDYYTELTSQLLDNTNRHTQLLAQKGRLALSGKKLKKFIGQTLLLKNRIAENLYIFDAPPETWEDEELDRLHSGLKKNFELTDRFRSVAEGLGIVKENLELFKDLLQDRYSNLLEWIIIALIAVEVVNFVVEKLG